MADEPSSGRIESRLTTLFPSTVLEDHTEAVGVIERDSKFQIPALVWALVFGFYALTGKSTISFGERIIKETVCEALETIREQNPIGRILLVADNYGSHHAKLTQERADELGIEFVFILPYSPTLNAIEPLWKSLKREISPEIYEDEEHLREFLTETFLRLSHRLSFAIDWIDTCLPDVQKLA